MDGATGLERPFLAMEYIEGTPLRKFAQQENPSKRERLNILVKICEAVHHAHQRSVIHRDLKPGNLLVDSDGQPSVLDFGVARATSVDSKLSTLQTRAGQLIGTLAYMSPEQVSGKGDNLDTRSDVYSLGLIAYELLSGQPPYDLKDADFLTAAKVISEDEPTALSSINREFRGDLNTVVLKALEKEPDRRYQSAKALGDDFQRYLDDQPVLARPATTLYQLKQFSKRNKSLVAGFLVSFALLIAGVIGTTIGMVNARAEAARKDAVNEFLKDILIAEDKSSGNANIKLATVLKDATTSVPDRFSEYPILEAEVSFLLALALSKVSQENEGEQLLRNAYDLRRAELGESNLLTRHLASHLAHQLAFSNATEAISIATESLQHTPSSEMQGLIALQSQSAIATAQVRLRQFETAIPKLREIVQVCNKSKDEGAKQVANYRLAWALNARAQDGASVNIEKDLGDADRLYREVIEYNIRVYGPTHGSTLLNYSPLAKVLFKLGKHDEAEKLYRKVIVLSSGLGPDHLLNLYARLDLAYLLYCQSRFSEASNMLLEENASVVTSRFEESIKRVNTLQQPANSSIGRCA